MTPTSITNLALAKLGANLIESIETDPASTLLQTHYDQCLGTALRMHPWNFATSDPTDLALVSPTPSPAPSGFDYLHALPGDFLKIQTLETARLPVSDLHYSLRKRRIWSVYDALTLTYTLSNPDLADALPDFIEAFSFLLASRLARPLLQSDRETETLEAQWRGALWRATAEDCNDNPSSLPYQGRDPAASSPLVQSRWWRTPARAANPAHYPVDPPA